MDKCIIVSSDMDFPKSIKIISEISPKVQFHIVGFEAKTCPIRRKYENNRIIQDKILYEELEEILKDDPIDFDL